MMDTGKRFITWLIKEKRFKNIGQYLVLPIEKRIELRMEFFKEEDKKPDERLGGID